MVELSTKNSFDLPLLATCLVADFDLDLDPLVDDFDLLFGAVGEVRLELPLLGDGEMDGATVS